MSEFPCPPVAIRTSPHSGDGSSHAMSDRDPIATFRFTTRLCSRILWMIALLASAGRGMSTRRCHRWHPGRNFQLEISVFQLRRDALKC